jgi:tetratricopeptide (TPR) repeat protein
MTVLQENPQAADAYFIMALIAKQHGNVAKAAEIILRALKFDADNVDYLLFQAQCLLELNRHEEAKVIAATLTDRQLASAHQNDTLGVLLSRLGQHAPALKHFTRACELNPDDVDYQYNLASCLQFSGIFGDAEAAYEKAIVLKPQHFRSHSSLSQLRRQTGDSNHIDRLLSLWSSLGDEADARLHIGHALAKEYEDLGDYRQAMHFMVEAKREKLKQLDTHGRDQAPLFAALNAMAAQLAEVPTQGFDSDEPIFIVGMPRTGTTLVERILSSHSRVKSAGELANFSLLVKRQVKSVSRWVLDVATIEQAQTLDFHRLGRDETPHFIDKMPLNFMYVPLIARALPQAKIICLRRNPMDTCLSNFRQLFSTGFSYYNYAYSLRDTAEFYVQFNALMQHFAILLGPRFHQLHYEALVEGPEDEARRLLDYCGLQWEPQCLDFQDNSAPVATASSVQVREKIYRRAIDRWRHYEPWLAEPMAIFDKHNIDYQ